MIANRSYCRRGSTYLVVLGGSMLVTVIGLSAVMATRVSRKTNEGLTDFMRARLYARSAIEMGFFEIGNNVNWRSSLPIGPWAVNDWGGTGSFSLSVTDPDDGDVTDSPTDPVLLTGTGTIGTAQYNLQVRLEARTPPVGCLETALHANNDLNFNNTVLNGDQIISANNSVNATGSAINADVEASSAIGGTAYTGTTTAPVAPRSMPDPTAVFDYYIANGTPIVVPGYLIDKQLLSPTSNPYGPTDPQGIYVVDCQGQDFMIQNSRIVGTLVLLDTGAGSQIMPEVNLESGVSDLPVLLVKGSFTVDTGANTLSESVTGVNFNPVGTPYMGVSDADTIDTYPAVINGLVYVSGDLLTSNNAVFRGVVVVGNTCSSQGNVTVDYTGNFMTNPPPGFTEPVRMLIAPGSWNRITN